MLRHLPQYVQGRIVRIGGEGARAGDDVRSDFDLAFQFRTEECRRAGRKLNRPKPANVAASTSQSRSALRMHPTVT